MSVDTIISNNINENEIELSVVEEQGNELTRRPTNELALEGLSELKLTRFPFFQPKVIVICF